VSYHTLVQHIPAITKIRTPDVDEPEWKIGVRYGPSSTMFTASTVAQHTASCDFGILPQGSNLVRAAQYWLTLFAICGAVGRVAKRKGPLLQHAHPTEKSASNLSDASIHRLVKGHSCQRINHIVSELRVRADKLLVRAGRGG
jgi:hypothetical protein